MGLMADKNLTKDEFLASHVIRMTGVSARELRYWQDIGIAIPSIQNLRRPGKPRIYNFEDVVRIRAIVILKSEGYSMLQMHRPGLIEECLQHTRGEIE